VLDAAESGSSAPLRRASARLKVTLARALDEA
jgi:hypothetical protein